jgi:hypothetical protein
LNPNYKNTIDNFLSSNFDILNKISNHYVIGTNLPPNDLVMELIVYLYENEEKVISYIDSPSSLIRFSKKWLWNQAKVYTKNVGPSNFKGKFQILDGGGEADMVVSNYNINLELNTPYEEDLISVYNTEQIGKIVFTNDYFNQLCDVDKRLYNLHFKERLSHTKIAKHLQTKYNQKVSPSSVYNMIVKLRTKIREEYNKSKCQ